MKSITKLNYQLKSNLKNEMVLMELTNCCNYCNCITSVTVLLISFNLMCINDF